MGGGEVGGVVVFVFEELQTGHVDGVGIVVDGEGEGHSLRGCSAKEIL